jgi:hypothetical protein
MNKWEGAKRGFWLRMSEFCPKIVRAHRRIFGDLWRFSEENAWTRSDIVGNALCGVLEGRTGVAVRSGTARRRILPSDPVRGQRRNGTEAVPYRATRHDGINGYSVANLYIVVDLKVLPGFRVVLGKSG